MLKHGAWVKVRGLTHVNHGGDHCVLSLDALRVLHHVNSRSIKTGALPLRTRVRGTWQQGGSRELGTCTSAPESNSCRARARKFQEATFIA